MVKIKRKDADNLVAWTIKQLQEQHNLDMIDVKKIFSRGYTYMIKKCNAAKEEV